MSGMRVLADESERGWWHMALREPAPPLGGLVTRYIGYRERSAVPVRRREVPTGEVTIILSFGPKIAVSDPRGGSGRELTSFVAPVDDTWAVTEYTGEQHGLEMTLTPLGASRLFGVPMDCLADPVTDVEDLLGRTGRLLAERLADASGWTERFDLLDALLPALFERGRPPSPAAAWAWRRLRETDGRIPIATLVDDLGCSHRYLVSQFRHHVGVTPKTPARVLRCGRAIRLLEQGGHRIGDIALDCGYSDQAHLNRDFRLLTGTTPGVWCQEMRLELPKPAEQVRFVQARTASRS
ncbi:AraC family transcriptional regulator [Saccharopolyspora erythraea NRRL 2338]|nr:AraC family transcriptional regulator [Saccharopolyspora erythraea]PFG95103.1 AraC family transcriptional regulator [Saccharopolyspora erythraea NRRL 2338]QRK91778.1 helix-turn-helix transcriptional regulator [Saccharopolyspora erythraea]CAM01321.1 probable transcriptional regulator [Saccharopolyspora erythraea NRRL 2338]